MSKKENKIKGNLGEYYACKFLEDQDYRIIERNFSASRGEIDIIVLDKDEIVFVEVKTRCQSFCGFPCESVNKIKKDHIYNVAEYYLYINNLLNSKVRFDVIEIYLYDNEKYTISHFKNAILDKPK